MFPSTRSFIAASGISFFAVTTLRICSREGTTSLCRCASTHPCSSRNSISGIANSASPCSTMNAPFFFFFRISSAAGSNPAAITPSDTTVARNSAVSTSTTSLIAAKSPNDDIGSAFRARRYASAAPRGSFSPTSYARFSASVSGTAIAAPAGDTCLNDAAATTPSAWRASFTSIQLFSASHRLMYPGLPCTMRNGRPKPRCLYSPAGFWCGLQPYFSSRTGRYGRVTITSVDCDGFSCRANQLLIAASYFADSANASAAKRRRSSSVVQPSCVFI